MKRSRSRARSIVEPVSHLIPIAEQIVLLVNGFGRGWMSGGRRKSNKTSRNGKSGRRSKMLLLYKKSTSSSSHYSRVPSPLRPYRVAFSRYPSWTRSVAGPAIEQLNLGFVPGMDYLFNQAALDWFHDNNCFSHCPCRN
jgi:hypothetical protein